MKLLLVEFLDLWERSPAWRNSIVAGLVGMIMVFFVRQSGMPSSPHPPPQTNPNQLQQPNCNPNQPNPSSPPCSNSSATNQNQPVSTVTTTTTNPVTTNPSAQTTAKRIDPPKKPKKASIPLDTKVGEYTPEPKPKTPQRNLNARQSELSLDTPVGEPTSKPSSEPSPTPPTRTSGRKPAMSLDTPVEQ